MTWIRRLAARKQSRKTSGTTLSVTRRRVHFSPLIVQREGRQLQAPLGHDVVDHRLTSATLARATSWGIAHRQVLSFWNVAFPGTDLAPAAASGVISRQGRIRTSVVRHVWRRSGRTYET